MIGLAAPQPPPSPFADTALDALKLADERMYANKRAVRMSDIKAV